LKINNYDLNECRWLSGDEQNTHAVDLVFNPGSPKSDSVANGSPRFNIHAEISCVALPHCVSGMGTAKSLHTSV